MHDLTSLREEEQVATESDDEASMDHEANPAAEITTPLTIGLIGGSIFLRHNAGEVTGLTWGYQASRTSANHHY